jgi:ribosomal-protein-alanine N-acetyltransferase
MVDCPPELETAGLRLTAIEDHHAETLFRIYSDAEAAQYWNKPDKSIEDSRSRIARMQSHWRAHGFGDWALIEKRSGRMIGFCGLHCIEGLDEINLGFLIDRAFWGHGFATQASRKSLHFGFDIKRLDLIAGTAATGNLAAIKVLEKCGFTFSRRIERNGTRAVYWLTQEAWLNNRADDSPALEVG